MLDPIDFPRFGGFLLRCADDLLAQLDDLLAQLGFLPGARAAAHLEQLARPRNHALHFGVVAARLEAGWKAHLFETVPFRFPARLAGAKFIEGSGHDREVGPSLRVVEASKDAALRDALAFLDAQLTDAPTGWMLHFLDARIDGELPRSDHCACEFGGRRPAADADSQQRGNEVACCEVLLNGPLGLQVEFSRGGGPVPVPTAAAAAHLSGQFPWAQTDSNGHAASPTACRRPLARLADGRPRQRCHREPEPT